jgi:hypothetical protein
MQEEHEQIAQLIGCRRQQQTIGGSQLRLGGLNGGRSLSARSPQRALIRARSMAYSFDLSLAARVYAASREFPSAVSPFPSDLCIPARRVELLSNWVARRLSENMIGPAVTTDGCKNKFRKVAGARRCSSFPPPAFCERGHRSLAGRLIAVGGVPPDHRGCGERPQRRHQTRRADMSQRAGLRWRHSRSRGGAKLAAAGTVGGLGAGRRLNGQGFGRGGLRRPLAIMPQAVAGD